MLGPFYETARPLLTQAPLVKRIAQIPANPTLSAPSEAGADPVALDHAGILPLRTAKANRAAVPGGSIRRWHRRQAEAD
jgi:hypothetical protein